MMVAFEKIIKQPQILITSWNDAGKNGILFIQMFGISKIF